MSHQLAVGFLDEVNPDTAPDYYEVVRRPLSFQDIMAKCREGAYNDSGGGGRSSSGCLLARAFAADVRHIFRTAAATTTQVRASSTSVQFECHGKWFIVSGSDAACHLLILFLLFNHRLQTKPPNKVRAVILSWVL